MSSELPQNPDWQIQEDRLQYGAEKKKQRDTARLIWASKPRKEPSPKDLDFQTAEIVIPNKATGDLRSFFETEKKEIDIQPNRLIWGDNLLVMQALLAQGYEGQIDLIYIDPPFNTGENFNFPNEVTIGDKTFEKEMPMSERLAYTDTWDRGIDSFLDMLYPRLQLMRRLLSEKGSIYVHIGPGMSSFVKFLLDEIFGAERYLNEIIWKRRLGQSQSERRRFGAVTDSILWYSKTEQYIFTPQFTKEGAEEYIRERYTQLTPNGRRFKLGDLSNPDYRPTLMYAYKGYPPPKKGWAVSLETMEKMDREGRIHFPTKPGAQLMRRQFLDEWKGKPIQSLWEDIPPINSQAKERLGFETQKPEPLIERIIKTATKDPEICKKEGIKMPLITDFFGGSGTTAAVAERLGCRWITTDLSKTAIQVTRARLVNQNAAPFLIQNLGNYQRQLIYMRDVKLREMYNIILKLYGAAR